MNYILGDIEIVSDLVAEPVSVTECKNWMKITFAEDDGVILGMVASARRMLEKYTGLSFGTKVLKVTIDVEDELFELPHGPLTEIDSVTAVIDMGNTQVLTAGTDYEKVSRLIRLRTKGLHIIEYKAGFTSLPSDLRTDILRLVAWMYANRGIQFEAEDDLKKYPSWQAMAANGYVKVML